MANCFVSINLGKKIIPSKIEKYFNVEEKMLKPC